MSRLEEVMLARGVRAAEIAEKADIDPSTLSKFVNGKRRLKLEWAARMAPVLRIEPLALLADEGSPIPEVAGPSLSLAQDGREGGQVIQMDAIRQTERKSSLSGGSVVVREYNVAASAGSGALPVLDGNGEAELVAEWMVPRDFLPPHYRNSTVAIIRVQGDSMAPEIMPEERVMVDVSQTWVGPEGIYLTWNGIGVVVKRLQVVPGEIRKIRFVSRNPAYEPYEQPADEVRVLGRVIGRWEWK